jgi:hypothetical protein
MAILSTGIVVILQALSFSARVTGLACDVTNAIFLAEDKLQKLELKLENVTDVPREGVEKNKFKWSYTLEVVPDENLLNKLDFSITWQRLKSEERIDLTTYLVNPK